MMNPLLHRTLVAVTLAALLLDINAQAQERKAYRHVDASGKVTYSQTPPADGKDAHKVDKVDISPAQRGRGGYVDGGGSYSSYDDPRYYAGQRAYNPYAGAAVRQSVYEQRHAELRAECLRQRGSDCDNPATLRYLDSTHIPRTGGVVRPPAPSYPRRNG